MLKRINNLLKVGLVVVLFFISGKIVWAADVNLTIRDGSNIIFSGTVALPTEVTSLNDSDGSPHTIDASSVLAVLNSADQTSDDFNISKLTYFSSFGSLYLKCITDTDGEKCDDWQYLVNDSYPQLGMDQNVLSGGENIYVYFGPQNKVLLSSENIHTNEVLVVIAQKYDYQNDAWIARDEVTVGITQPDPNNPFSPTEILTNTVNGTGEAIFSSIPEGSYDVGIKEDFYFPTEALTVTAPSSSNSTVQISHGSSKRKKVEGSVLGTTVEAKFDLEKAFEYIISQQKEDGSFGADLYTDWTALTLASGNYQDQTIKLIKYFGISKLTDASLTDYERRSMALMALGLNPYSINGEDYIKKITDSFDGKQFGDVGEDNDDIFALIVLQNAGFTQAEKMISDDINFILNRQKENGSWDESVDMTGAGIEALAVFSEQNDQVKDSLAKAKEFLKQNQKDTGGWGNVSSTAWAMEGILALAEKPEDWKKDDKTPNNYLLANQDTDGGMKNENIENKIWETVYVISAMSGKTWNPIMQKFEKLEIPVAPKVPTKINKKQNIAAPIVAIEDKPMEETTPEAPENKSWLRKFLDFIF